jgi:hypothetical protein
VWKVETIGDSYVAVLGGPLERTEHGERAVLLELMPLLVWAPGCRLPEEVAMVAIQETWVVVDLLAESDSLGKQISVFCCKHVIISS